MRSGASKLAAAKSRRCWNTPYCRLVLVGTDRSGPRRRLVRELGDFPVVQAVNDTFWAAHYLQRTPGGKYLTTFRCAYQMMVDEVGMTQVGPTTMELTEHGFVSLYPHNNRLGIIWLNGRAVATSGGEGGDHAHHGAMTLRSAFMDAKGRLSRNSRLILES